MSLRVLGGNLGIHHTTVSKRIQRLKLEGRPITDASIAGFRSRPTFRKALAQKPLSKKLMIRLERAAQQHGGLAPAIEKFLRGELRTYPRTSWQNAHQGVTSTSVPSVDSDSSGIVTSVSSVPPTNH